MGIGIIQNHSQYKNICGNYTYHMPAPVCQSKMKDLGDEFVLTEKMMETIIFIVMPLRGIYKCSGKRIRFGSCGFIVIEHWHQ